MKKKIVALVLAGGEGTRLYPLTAEHAKPALPFANGYRICDFVLSNLVNSKISTIYVLAQYKPESLIRHIQASSTFKTKPRPPLAVPSGRCPTIASPTSVPTKTPAHPTITVYW